MKHVFTFLMALVVVGQLHAENGSRLWLRLRMNQTSASVSCNKQSTSASIAVRELEDNWQGSPVYLLIDRSAEIKTLGEEGYAIRRNDSNGDVTIRAYTDKGLIYGAYHLLRLQQEGKADRPINIAEGPLYNRRILNHWDNLDGTVERGYAGRSIWKWEELPDMILPRYEEYARANASIGINGTVLNNVNASPKILSAEYLEKVRALAGVFRPYNVKVYLAINFSSPAELGGLPTSDPLDKDVVRWWREKVKEIYRLIPDFGGFLVKANSEGLPGPQDFGRTHADGANMLADALKPYNGIVMWRAFVYNPGDEDRAKQAYQEFMPLDGQFRDNVIIQIKNGPVDFQPREPISPLLATMKKTAVMPELQITQEYLGFANHVAYLAPMWKECLNHDIYPENVTAIAGVANIGDDTNWCGHHLAQANWYAFGRLAWNPNFSSEEIGEEWVKLTFSFTNSQLSKLLLASREAVVNYMMPLGLHHLFAWGHHYGPEPWCDVPGARPDWMPRYYHRADSLGIGFDRSSTGSNAIAQYPAPFNELYDNIDTCPEDLILWFHHVPWNHRMKSGRTLWEELCYKYDEGVQQARSFQEIWDTLEPYIDEERFQAVQSKLKIQTRDAVWWKDACLLYFQEYSKLPIPYEIERPVHELERLKEYRLEIGNYENAVR